VLEHARGVVGEQPGRAVGARVDALGRDYPGVLEQAAGGEGLEALESLR
jgi:hypothetical protein